MRKPQKAACSFEGILLILVVGFCVFSIQMNLRSHDRIVSIPMELPERVGVVTLYEIIPDYVDTYQFIIDQRRGGGELLASLEIEPFVEPLAPELPIITINRYFDREEVDCLAKNIYFEAKTESIKGQVAVGLVTLNRVMGRHYPNTVCEVVYERKQFSWYSDGLSDRPRQFAAWEEARLIASALLDTDTSIAKLVS